MIQQFIELLEGSGFCVLDLPNEGTIRGYQAQRQGGYVKAIMTTAERRMFWTVEVPESAIAAGDRAAVLRLVESRYPLSEGV